MRPGDAGDVLRLGFRSASQALCVEVSPELAPYVEPLFTDYRTAPPNDPPLLELISAGSGVRCVTPGSATDHPRLADAMSDFEYALAQALADRFGKPLIHAGGVVTRDGALLLAGHSGSGKSSVTAAFAARGYPLLGDDAIGLEADRPGVTPFKRRVKVHEGAAATLGLAPAHPLLEEIWPEEAHLHPADLGTVWSEGAVVDRILFPERNAGVDPSLSPLGSGNGIRTLMELVLQGAGAPAAMFEVLASVTRHARYHRLVFDSCVEAVLHVERTLGLAPPHEPARERLGEPPRERPEARGR